MGRPPRYLYRWSRPRHQPPEGKSTTTAPKPMGPDPPAHEDRTGKRPPPPTHAGGPTAQRPTGDRPTATPRRRRRSGQNQEGTRTPTRLSRGCRAPTRHRREGSANAKAKRRRTTATKQMAPRRSQREPREPRATAPKLMALVTPWRSNRARPGAEPPPRLCGGWRSTRAAPSTTRDRRGCV